MKCESVGKPRVCNMCKSVYYMLSVDMSSVGSVVGSVSSMGSVSMGSVGYPQWVVWWV